MKKWKETNEKKVTTHQVNFIKKGLEEAFDMRLFDIN